MKNTACAVTAAAVLCASPVAAQVPTFNDVKIACGDVRTTNEAHQFGQYGTWLEYTASTTRTLNLCTLTVSVYAEVVNVPQSSLGDWGFISIAVSKQVLVPAPGHYQVNSYHALTWFISTVPLGFYTINLPPLKVPIEIVARGEPEPDSDGLCEGGIDCRALNGTVTCESCTPIVVDANGDGYALTSAAEGVRFDIDADGTLDQVAWTQADSDDAFLAMDRNGNGRIDDGRELFGSYTPAVPGSKSTCPNGFEALEFLEHAAYGSSLRDGVINNIDAPFARLLLWTDRNHNGISEPDELVAATNAGLIAIDTRYKESRKRDRHGNEFRQRAKATWIDGSEFYIYDVWLRRQR